jgi:PAS domain S-box-containing protein
MIRVEGRDLEVRTTPPQGRKHKGSILVIDDDPASLQPLFTILTEDGYAVNERQLDLESQLRFVKDTLPDLVLVDVRKPGMDGYRVCASLKNEPTTRAIPVIFISSIGRSINQAKALLSGAVDYVTDPFDAEEVLWRIETHISLRRLREYLESAARNRVAPAVAPNEDLERALQEIRVLTQVTGRKHAEEKMRQAARELKQTQAALQASERNLMLTIDTIPTFITVSRADGTVLSVNQAALDYHGITLQEVQRGEHRTRFYHPDDVERVRELRTEGLKHPRPFEYELRAMGKDGKYRWFSVRHSPLLDDQGRIERWYAIAFDIEDRKRAEEALNRARSELAHIARVTTLSALTASIAHEINQPIAAATTSAGACLRWLNRDQPEVQRAREAVMRIEEDVKRAAAIIAHLKSFYRKDFSPEREAVSINDLVDEMVVLLRSEADRHSVVMHTELTTDLPSVRADRVQLQQVLMNLMLNGMESMTERGGEITISTARGGGEVMVSVTDAGVGIPADKLEDIFNAFVTTKAGGTGMGLAISRTIIESHGGRLWAMVNPGPGATFHFTLPTELRPK